MGMGVKALGVLVSRYWIFLNFCNLPWRASVLLAVPVGGDIISHFHVSASVDSVVLLAQETALLEFLLFKCSKCYVLV